MDTEDEITFEVQAGSDILETDVSIVGQIELDTISVYAASA